ncbi:hypothetical protein ACTFIU_011157 [Dictyostelium citrinum]
MDQQVKLLSMQAVPTIVFRRTRSKLTSRWTFVPLQTSLERIGSSKLLSRGSKWIKSPCTNKLQIIVHPNTDIYSRGSEITVHQKVITKLSSRRCHRARTSNQYSKLFFYSNLNEPTSSMVKLDIKKAYLHFLVHPHYRYLFPFVWKGVHYRWNTMPFGLSTDPRIFTMLLRPVLRMLRELNVSVIAYLDDLLIIGSTKEECLSNLDKTMKLLVKLGFKLNLEKSVLEPTQSITFLGFHIDSVSMKLLFPKEKKKNVIKEIRNFLKLDSCSPRILEGEKGKLISLKDAVIQFRLYSRN